ncbi:MAG: sulfite exporter TauE/SafE family protein, partial [Tepidiformaceae bacterium]
MHIDPLIALAGLLVGFVVGLTGMGGGALTTPLLVLVFRVQPLAAVSSDLVAAVIMKPVGGAVHMRRGTVNKQIVGWLVLGSVPSAFSGALLLQAFGSGSGVQDAITLALGVALVAGAAGIALRALGSSSRKAAVPDVAYRPSRRRIALTVVIGVAGGLIVGLTSVGSGSIMVVLLMMLYPRLTTSELVGTDLVQAIPLVGSAAAGHLLFGDFRLGLTVSLLIGSIPGVYVGARLSSRSNLPFIRPALAIVLLLSGAKLLNASNVELGLVFVTAVG